jgi:hypothetical protein
MSTDAQGGSVLDRAHDLRATGCAYCERDAEGMVAATREPACSRCAGVLDAAEEPVVTDPDEVLADVDPARTLQAGLDVQALVDVLEEKRRRARHHYGANKDLQRQLEAKWHAGRADGLRHAISLLTDRTEVAPDV